MLHQPKIYFKGGDGSSTQRNFQWFILLDLRPRKRLSKNHFPHAKPLVPVSLGTRVPCSNGRFGSHWRRSLKRSSGLSSCTLVALGSICTCKTFFIRSQLSFFVYMPCFPLKNLPSFVFPKRPIPNSARLEVPSAFATHQKGENRPRESDSAVATGKGLNRLRLRSQHIGHMLK